MWMFVGYWVFWVMCVLLVFVCVLLLLCFGIFGGVIQMFVIDMDIVFVVDMIVSIVVEDWGDGEL